MGLHRSAPARFPVESRVPRIPPQRAAVCRRDRGDAPLRGYLRVLAEMIAIKMGDPMKFAFLGYHLEQDWATMSEAEQAAMIDDCFTYDRKLLKDGHITDDGAALQPS